MVSGHIIWHTIFNVICKAIIVLPCILWNGQYASNLLIRFQINLLTSASSLCKNKRKGRERDRLGHNCLSIVDQTNKLHPEKFLYLERSFSYLDWVSIVIAFMSMHFLFFLIFLSIIMICKICCHFLNEIL